MTGRERRRPGVWPPYGKMAIADRRYTRTGNDGPYDVVRADVGIGPYDGMFSTNPNFSPLVKLFLIMIADCPEYVI